MSNIQKHQKNEIYVNDKDKVIIPNDLPISRRTRAVYLSNVNHPKIKVISDKNYVVNTIHTYLNQTILDSAHRLESEEISYLKKRVTDDIMESFSHLTLEEVRLAFYYGVRGEMGEFYGLGAKTFYKWLKDFKYDIFSKAFKEVSKYLPKEEEKPTPKREMHQQIAKTIYDVYWDLCINGVYEFYDIGNVAYNFLDEIGLIPFTTEERLKMLEQSRNYFRRHLSNKNRELQAKGKHFHKINLERAFKQLEQNSNPTFEHQVKVGAKRIAVKNLLYQLAENEVDLKKVIDKRLSKINYDDEK